MVMLGIEAASALPIADATLALGKGAIIGAMLVSAAFLAGIAVLRRSAAAFCGLLLLLAAGGLQSVWLGVVAAPSPTIAYLLQGLFAAAALIFLSSTITMIGRNQLLGGLLFAVALSMVGIGVINAVLGGEASGLQRIGMAAVAAAVLGLSAIASARGELGARLILPGAALVVLAPLLFDFAGGAGVASLAPQAVFAIGVLMASLVALSDFGAVPAGGLPDFSATRQFNIEDRGGQRVTASQSHAMRVSENQLAQVLDYAGVAVWDWNRSGSHQTASFAALMGADSDGAFTPEAFRAFVHADDLARFERQVYGAADGDGGFDETIRLVDGRRLRLRGARAVDHHGMLERIVAFLEEATPTAANALQNASSLKLAASSLAGSPIAIPSSAGGPVPPRDPIAAAIERGEIIAAFQPIVSLEDGKIRGAEALVRWPADDNADGKASITEEIVRKAQAAGKGGALASIMLNAAAKHVSERVAAGEESYFAAFNVSVSQVREEGFVDEVRKAIADHKLPKGSLVLELTEGERLAETPRIIETFKKLKAAGASLAYDDFGAGFSSLSNLHRYDFDYLKIDKSFLDDIVANGGKKKIVAALARLGRDFDMTVIAEGVESKEAAETARAIGCRLGQGYYLGAPAVVTTEAPAKEKAAVAAAPELATIESEQAAAGELVLNRSHEATRPASRLFRRKVFGAR